MNSIQCRAAFSIGASQKEHSSLVSLKHCFLESLYVLDTDTDSNYVQVAAAAGEAENPRRNIPKAVRRVFWAILFFYVLGSLAIGVLISKMPRNYWMHGKAMHQVELLPHELLPFTAPLSLYCRR